MPRRTAALVLVLLFVLGLVPGCLKKAETPKEDPKLKIGLLPIVDALPFWIAEQKGYFSQMGINVELVPFTAAVERDAVIQAGGIDGYVGDLLSAVLMKNGGVDIRIASVGLGATPEEGRFAILAAPGSGIESADQLKGVEVAISQNSIIEYINEQLLLAAGLKPEEIKVVSVPKIPVRFEMLVKGQIKAATLPDPLAKLAEVQGAKLVLDDTKGTNLSQTVILFRQDAISAKPETIKKLLKAYSMAVADINSKPDDFRGILVEKARLPEPIKESYQIDHFSAPQAPKAEDVGRVVPWVFFYI